MLEIFKPFWGIIVKWTGIAIGILLILFKVRQSGKEVEQRKQAMETLKGLQTRDEIENNVSNISDTRLAKLHKLWTRK